MRKYLVTFLLIVFTYCSNVPFAFCAEFLLETGTRIPLRLVSSVSSFSNTEGDILVFKVDEDIKIGDVILVKEGAPAYGFVTDVIPAGRIGQPGYISISLDYLKAVNGKKIGLTNVYSKRGIDKRFSTIALSLFIPLFLIIKGTDAKFPTGYKVMARIDRDVFIDIADSEIFSINNFK